VGEEERRRVIMPPLFALTISKAAFPGITDENFHSVFDAVVHSLVSLTR
jgi:hypothetical protein